VPAANESSTADAALPSTDLILFACFNYGCLPQALVDAIVERAVARSVMMAADSQASSQLADISRFKTMTLITPTEREARLALNDFESGLAVISERLLEKARAEAFRLRSGETRMVSGRLDKTLGMVSGLPKAALPSRRSAL